MMEESLEAAQGREVISKEIKSLKVLLRLLAAAYALYTWPTSQESRPIFRAKASIPLDAAKDISITRIVSHPETDDLFLCGLTILPSLNSIVICVPNDMMCEYKVFGGGRINRDAGDVRDHVRRVRYIW